MHSINIRSSNKTASAFKSPPRYVVSANYTPAAPNASSPSASAPSYGRKKPIFVLPRSPSPDAENASSDPSQPPAAFSPTLLKGLHRRGRPASSNTAARYVPGGLAEQLRDWILEKGVEREQTLHHQSRRNNEAYDMLTARIDSCRNAYLKSSGDVIMAQATQISTGNGEEQGDTQQKEILLLGASSSRASSNFRPTSGTILKAGDMIGIRAGLTWEIKLDIAKESRKEDDISRPNSRVIASSQSPSEGDEDDGENEDDGHEMNINLADSPLQPQKTWLVAAEWVRLS